MSVTLTTTVAYLLCLCAIQGKNGFALENPGFGQSCVFNLVLDQALQLNELKSHMKELAVKHDQEVALLNEKILALEQKTFSLETTVNKTEEERKELKPSQEGLSSLERDAEGYYLAFRAIAHNGVNVFDSYTAVGKNSDHDAVVKESLSCGCTGGNGRADCGRHYRSVLLDLWDRLPVEKVRVSAYIKGKEQLRIVFDGKGTDYLNFFRQDKVLESPFDDLASAVPNYFSVEGHPYKAEVKRRFFMSNNYGGCEIDAGWLVVVDGNRPGAGTCDWDNAFPDLFPKIIFSKDKAFVNWTSGNLGRADVLTVSIKLKDNVPCEEDLEA